VSQEELNDELSQAILKQDVPRDQKLAQIDSLVGEGAQLNGSGGKYGTDPSDAVSMSKDVDLLYALMDRGLKIRNGQDGCTAFWMHQGLALDPGGDAMLDALLARGMDVRCVGGGTQGPLTVFLTWGMGARKYPIDGAVRAARVLIKYGANVNQRDSDGRTIFDHINEHLAANPELATLRDVLLNPTSSDAANLQPAEADLGSPSTKRSPAPPPDSIARFLTDAEQKMARRDYDGALTDAENAVRVAPNDSRATALLERVRRIRAILR
jgi:hypothetical protein